MFDFCGFVPRYTWLPRHSFAYHVHNKAVQVECMISSPHWLYIASMYRETGSSYIVPVYILNEKPGPAVARQEDGGFLTYPLFRPNL